MISFAITAPIALDSEISVGFKLVLNAAVINTGKYGTGTKTTILPTKLISNIPKYPKSS
jgi:hypothetical protein